MPAVAVSSDHTATSIQLSQTEDVLPHPQESAAQGPEGQVVARIIETARKHWNELAQRRPRITAQEDGYRPVPPTRSFVVRVRFESWGRGAPPSYPSDNE